MADIILPHQWRPRPYQQNLWSYLENGGKRAIAIWHRRAGKDDIALHATAVALTARPGTYWHCLPTYAQSRKAIWQAINPHSGKRRIDEAFPLAIRASTNEQEMFIRFKNGSTWTVIGSNTYDALVGAPPAGIVFSEWSRANPASWAYLAPILVENNGWALFITTPLGNNHAKAMLDMARADPSWFAEVQTVSDTNAISPDAVAQQRKEYCALFGEAAGNALIEQEFYCSFSAVTPGAYYTVEMTLAEREGRICEIDVTPGLPVHTAWDLGVDDPCAIWCFQVEPGRVNVVDYYENSGQGLRHYTDWLAARGYHGIDWLPHDARARELGDQVTPRTRVQNLIGLGRKPRICLHHTVMDGINAGRQTIPRAWFDAGRCARGLECLRQYQAEWCEELRTFKRTPLHNFASHAADAWRVLAVSWREPMAPEEDEETKRERMFREMIQRPSINEMVRQHFEDLGLEPREDFAEID